MKSVRRLGGMASLLLLASLFSPAKSSASEPIQNNNSDSNLDERIAAVHQKLAAAETQLSGNHTSAEMAELVAQWGDWGNWGDWGDWVDWGDWGDWVNWGDWADWGDWYDY